MAKKRKVTIGSVVKGRDGKADYIKINGDHVLNNGQFLNLESKQSQLESLDKALAEGKLTEEIVDTMRERIEKIPDFVRFSVTTMVEQD